MDVSIKLGGEDHAVSKLYLVRVQDNFDNSKVENDRLILARQEGGRNTFHFTVNAVVESHAYGKFNGEAVVISPLKESFANGQHPSGFGMADTWINAAPDKTISLPRATLIVPRDSAVPSGVDVIRYDRGADVTATIAARDKAVAAFFDSKGASLRKVGFDNWSDGAASQDEYGKLLKAVVGGDAAEKVYVGRHSNSYDGKLEDLFAMKGKITDDARSGAKYWEDPTGAQLPIAYRVKQLDQEIGDNLTRAIAGSPSRDASAFYAQKMAEHVPQAPVATVTPGPYQQGRAGGLAPAPAAPALTPYQQGRSGVDVPRVSPPAASLQAAPAAAEVKSARGMRR